MLPARLISANPNRPRRRPYQRARRSKHSRRVFWHTQLVAHSTLLSTAFSDSSFSQMRCSELVFQISSVPALIRGSFGAFIKSQSPTYDGRRRFIREALKPVEANLDGTSDGLSVRSSEQPPSGRPAAINTVGVEPTRRKLGVFLCHASGDKEAVRELYRRLLADGFDPWLDEEKLLPGQDWEREIYHAVHDCDVVVVCLSSNSITKTGYVQKELRIALDFADHQPEGLIFVIPAKLEQCVVPDRLLKWQWVNLHEPFGYTRLVQALGTRASTLSAPDDKS